MSPGEMCDEILNLINEVLPETTGDNQATQEELASPAEPESHVAATGLQNVVFGNWDWLHKAS